MSSESELNAVFFENILQSYENDKSIKINSVEITPAVGKGENFTSIVSKVLITGKRNAKHSYCDFSRSLIVKKPFKSQEAQDYFSTKQLFANEVYAYNHIVPALTESTNLDLAVAKCIYADVNTVVLENLTTNGYEMNQNRKNLTLEECSAVLKELAKLHAASIIMKKKDSIGFKNISEYVGELFREDNLVFKGFAEQSFKNTMQFLNEQSDLRAKQALNELSIRKESVYSEICSLLREKKDTYVINHGDCWMNNLLFKKTNNNINAKLIDLQIMRYTSVAADLNYFLYINMDPDDIKNNLNSYLDTYLAVFHKCLKEHNLENELETYSKQWLVKEMKEFTVFGFLFALWITPVLYINKNDLPDIESFGSQDNSAEFVKASSDLFKTAEYSNKIISLVLNFANLNHD